MPTATLRFAIASQTGPILDAMQAELASRATANISRRKPLDQLTPAYRRRLERAAALGLGDDRAAARGHAKTGSVSVSTLRAFKEAAAKRVRVEDQRPNRAEMFQAAARMKETELPYFPTPEAAYAYFRGTLSQKDAYTFWWYS